jgi:hypothetical protein
LWKVCNFGVVNCFSAIEGFCQQLCQFLPNHLSKDVELTIISYGIDFDLQINKNNCIYWETSWKKHNFGVVGCVSSTTLSIPPPTVYPKMSKSPSFPTQ